MGRVANICRKVTVNDETFFSYGDGRLFVVKVGEDTATCFDNMFIDLKAHDEFFDSKEALVSHTSNLKQYLSYKLSL